LTRREAARLLGVTTQRVSRLAFDGKLPALKIRSTLWLLKAGVESRQSEFSTWGKRPVVCRNNHLMTEETIWRSGTRSNGRPAWRCKLCARDRAYQWNLEHPEKKREYNRRAYSRRSPPSELLREPAGAAGGEGT
jgi:excisionase family DNA binding protein